jgi:hypothetical protein
MVIKFQYISHSLLYFVYCALIASHFGVIDDYWLTVYFLLKIIPEH